MTHYWRRSTGRTRIGVLVGLALVLVTAAGLLVMSATSSAQTGTAPVPPSANFDASVPPSNVLPVIIVSGTPYEMGYQYGQQAKDLIARSACSTESFLLGMPGLTTWNDIAQRADTVKALVAAKTPEIIDWWQGIADGSGQSLETVIMISAGPSSGPRPLPAARSRPGALRPRTTS